MAQIEACEFGFVQTLPKREKSRFQRLWDHFQELRRVTEEKGMLVPFRLAAKIGGVSQQRVDQLCNSGRLERVFVDGHPFVTEISLIGWARSERKAGRPSKAAVRAEREEAWQRQFGR